MVDPRLVAEWLIKADEDFGFALVNLEEGKPFHDSDAEASSARDRAGQIKAWVDSKVGSSRTLYL